MKAVAFVFPGQGSQFVGMGRDFLESVPGAAQVLEAAEDITGLPLRRLCLEGPMEELTRTATLQPALTAVEIVCCMGVRNAGIEASAVAGHSLGEYPALWAAAVLSLEDTLRLVHARGRLMEEAADRSPGAMAAVIGLSRQELEGLIPSVAEGGVLALANHNSPEQIVVTGEKNLVGALCKAAKGVGARAIPLKVAGAYHSPLMEEASRKFAEILRDVAFSAPTTPLYSNVTARAESDPETIRGLLARQICAPVRWYEIVTAMEGGGASAFIEVGPKKVLTNLIKKCLPERPVAICQIEDPAGIEECLRELG